MFTGIKKLFFRKKLNINKIINKEYKKIIIYY